MLTCCRHFPQWPGVPAYCKLTLTVRPTISPTIYKETLVTLYLEQYGVLHWLNTQKRSRTLLTKLQGIPSINFDSSASSFNVVLQKSQNKWGVVIKVYSFLEHPTRWVQKMHLKEMCDFWTLKMLPLALALIKTKKKPSFWPIGQKMPIYIEKLEFWMTRANFPLKKRGFIPMRKKMAIFCFDQCQSQW